MRPPPAGPAHRESVTLAVEYEDHLILSSLGSSTDLHSRVAGDLQVLGLPRVSRRDIELQGGGKLQVTLKCLPAQLDRIQTLESGKEEDLNAKKLHCGIKRIWSLTILHASYLLAGHKRSYSQITCETHEHASKRGSSPHQNMGSASPSASSGSTSSGSSRHGWTNDSEKSHASPRYSRISKLAQSPDLSVDDAAKIPHWFSPRIQPLDQSELSGIPSSRPTITDSPESVLDESRATSDPRIQGPSPSSIHISPPSSPIAKFKSGYYAGAQVLVQTDETRACGSDARMRRLFAREKSQVRERLEEVERERDELRMQVRALEQERMETCTELEERRQRCKMLESQMDDIRKECVRPFVVPVLVDAFLKIGKLQDQLLEG